MAQGDTPITVVGNLTADPELRFTTNGVPVASFTVASTPRRWDSQSGSYVDGDPLFMNCNIWRQPAENVANSLRKGDRVVVTGNLRQRRYQTREGENRTVMELQVDEVGASLRFATVDISKTTGGSRGSYGGGSQSSDRGQNFSQNSGANQGFNSGNFGSQGAGDDPWSSAPQSGFGGGDDAPPF